MAVTKYEKDGVTLWSVYVDFRSTVNRKVRVQRRVNGIETERAALAEEKKLLAELSKRLTKEESEGTFWEEVIDRWELDKLSFSLDDYSPITVRDYAAMLRTYTKMWFGRPSQSLTRGDGREVLRYAKEQGKNFVFVRRLKNTINLVYNWGIEEKIIQGVHTSPVFGIDLGKQKEEALPEILTLDEIRTFLRVAKGRQDLWTPVWTMALLTGMRSGELHALPWRNVQMVPPQEAKKQDALPPEKRNYGSIRVDRSYNCRLRTIKDTKAGYWRTVPISGELYWFLVDLRIETGDSEFVLPRFWQWDKGQQAQILRKFCIDSGLKSIKFHTLRACFGTQLISSGVPPSIVMKICGWKDLKTMQRYIRLAGVEERGATESLQFLPPDVAEKVAVGNVVRLFDF